MGARGGVVVAMRESMGGSATDSGGTEGALTAMSTAFLAQQILPLQKFDGATTYECRHRINHRVARTV